MNGEAGFRAFTSAFVVAFLLDFAEDWRPWPVVLAYVMLAAWVLRRATPTRLLIWSLLSASWIVLHLPALSNHYSLYLLICLAIGGYVAVRHRISADAEVLWPGLRTALALTTALMYLGAGFHKLNADFLDPAVSCALDYSIRLSTWYHLPEVPRATWAVALFGGATLLWELGGGALLLFRRTQWLVVITCAVAHGVLSLMMFYDFSALAVALFVAFVPEPLRARIDERAHVYGVSVLVLTMVAGAFHATLTFANTQRLVGAAFVLIAGWFLLSDARQWRGHGTAVLGGASPASLVLPATVLLLAATPYLGLRTTGNLSMFSNLRTEMGASNHLVIPSGYQPFGYQQSVVFVTRHDEPVYNDRWEDIRGFALIDVAVDVEREFLLQRNGEVHVAREGSPAEPLSELAPTSTRLERTLLHFRPIQTSGSANLCRW